VVITRLPVHEYVPLAKNDDSVVTQYIMTTLEELGLLKMDFLGLRNLTVIEDAEQMIRRKVPGFSVANVPEDDEKVFQMITAGRTSGVFQMESAGMTGVCVSMKPQSIEDLTAIIALYRPGPMESIPKFVACKHDPSLITYLHPSLEPILSVTYGCIVYQEQVIEIFRKLGGYSMGQADMVRRAISKKKQKEIIKERATFVHGDTERGIPGAVANGIPESVAEAIYDQIYDFANYAFNKAHAVCYAIVAYRTAYLKYYYPGEYMAALLTSVLENSDKVAEYIAECRELGLKLLPPDINHSGAEFMVEADGIRFGLVAVKGVGQGAIQGIVKERQEKGPYRSFQEFCQRAYDCDLNRRVVENLIRCGAFDSLGSKRSQLMEVYGTILDSIADSRKRNLEGQFDLFGGFGDQDMGEMSQIPLPDMAEFPKSELMRMEKETTGLYLSGHPMDEYREIVRRAKAVTIVALKSDFADPEGPARFHDGQKVTLAGVVTSMKTKTTKNKSLMAYVTLEDDTGDLEMLVFSRTLTESGDLLREGTAIFVDGRISARDDKSPQIMCDKVRSLLDAGKSQPVKEEPAGAQKLFVKVPSERSPVFQKIFKLFLMFPGREQVVLYVEDSKRRLGGTALLHPAMLDQLREWLGDDAVVVQTI
jgi:DNA polymerase-3 subunit alpha